MEFKKELNIFQRVQGIMSELNFIQKSDKKVNGQYSFVGHDMVTEKVHPLLVKWGIVAIPTVIQDEQDGNRTVARVKMTLYNVDNPAEIIESTMFGYGVDSQDKGPGKAVSYATKMIWLKLLCLESGEKDVELDFEEYKPKKKEITPAEAQEAGNDFKKKPIRSGL